MDYIIEKIPDEKDLNSKEYSKKFDKEWEKEFGAEGTKIWTPEEFFAFLNKVKKFEVSVK